MNRVLDLVPRWALKRWDRWTYSVWSPSSLDDAPVVKVRLMNRSGTSMTFVISLSPSIIREEVEV